MQINVMSSIHQWLSHERPHAAKHRGWKHPLATCVVHYLIVSIVTFGAHDFLVSRIYQDDMASCYPDTSSHLRERRLVVTTFLCFYATWLLLWRLFILEQHRQAVLYEYCFLCNVTLVLSAAALASNRPLIAGAYCVTVGIDQLLWYVDLTGFACTNKFPIGVSKYVFWKGTTLSTRITCTHHLWTIPLLLYASGGLHVRTLPLSAVVMTANVMLSRWMTPSHIAIRNYNDDRNADGETSDSFKYLNVNLSHDLWKDIKFDFLQISRDDPPAHVYLFRLLWRWQVLNSLVFGLLYVLCQRVYGRAPVC